MSEQICQKCQRVNPAEALICVGCGHLLPASEHSRAPESPHATQTLHRPSRWGTAYFGDESVLQIRILHSGACVEASFRRECVLGRAAGDLVPDLDLSPHGALAMGVSRQHARLLRRFGTVQVEDLGSVNGTFLNGERLLPRQPRILRHDDELMLGRLALRISFERQPSQDGQPPAPPVPDSP